VNAKELKKIQKYQYSLLKKKFGPDTAMWTLYGWIKKELAFVTRYCHPTTPENYDHILITTLNPINRKIMYDIFTLDYTYTKNEEIIKNTKGIHFQ